MTASVIKQRTLSSSAMTKVAFAILGATIRDDRKRIVELAEEKSLSTDSEICQQSRSDLTSPRTRLASEIAWLPGVSPKKASALLLTLEQDPLSIAGESGLPDLAHANLFAAAFDALDSSDSSDFLAEIIERFAGLVDGIDVTDVLRDINEDRSISGFPEVKGIEQIEEELSLRKRHYRNAVKNALDKQSPENLVQTMTLLVNSSTLDGEIHAPELIDDLVDSYSLEASDFLDKEKSNIEALIVSARNAIPNGEASVNLQIDKLVPVIKNWIKIATPIQVSSKARGLKHEPSTSVAYAIRSLGIDLFNNHDYVAASKRITTLLKDLFSEIPEISERVEKDSIDMEEIVADRKDAEVRKKEWDKDITFHAEVGLVFKDELSISPKGVRWKDKVFPLDSITGVRWGAIRHSVNGIPTGTDYTIGLASRNGSTEINLRKEATYNNFLNALWKGVCVRLIFDLMEALKGGKALNFGDMLVEDTHITLIRHKFLSANEKVRLDWSEVTIWTADASVYVGSKADKKTYGSATYMGAWNAHIFEHVIRGAFKKGVDRLSDYL